MSHSFDTQYLDTLKNILENGHHKTDRTGTGTVSLFGQMIRLDISDYKLPLLSTKKMFYRSFVHETLWFISGSTDISYLLDNNIHIWDSWVKAGTERYEYRNWKKFYAGFKNANDAIAFDQLRIASGIVETSELDEPKHTELLQVAAHFGVKTKDLVGGSIGTGAYGALWRHWEDTRIVECAQVNYYTRQGYSVVAAIPEIKNKLVDNSAHVGKMVLTRNIDQLQDAIDLLRTNPDSRRIIVSAWNPGKTIDAALPPCHSIFQFHSRLLDPREIASYADALDRDDVTAAFEELLNEEAHPDEETDNQVLEDGIYALAKRFKLPTRALSLMIVCRSQDVPVGTPFNISQYALLAHLVAHVTGHLATELVWVGGDAHIYDDQIELVKQQLKRAEYEQCVKVRLNPSCTEIDHFGYNDIEITGYDNCHPAIPYPVAI